MKRSAVVICLYLLAFRAGAQSPGAAAEEADDAYEDAESTYNEDVANGASSAQQVDDYKVMAATLAADDAANDAADRAEDEAQSAQAAADNDNLAAAEAAASRRRR